MEIEEQKVYQEMVDALNSHDKDRIAKAKYDFLFFGRNIFDVVINYITLINNGVDFDFGYRTIKKGTKLFRIRRFESGVDFSDESQWKNPPSKPENRANSNGESALYLGTTENICLLETHIQNGEKYVLGEYEVVDDFVVGGFLSCEDFHNKYAYLTGMILNAFLIAPSRSDKNARLFNFLDDTYGDLKLSDLTIKLTNDIDLPLKFGVVNKRGFYYKATNKLLMQIKNKYPNGLSYSSCYIPMSTIYIKCSDENVVLFETGMNKIKFMKCSIKVNETKLDDIELYKLLIDTKNKNNTHCDD